MADATSLSRRTVLRPCGSATSINGWPSPHFGQSRPPDQVWRHTGQIFSIGPHGRSAGMPKSFDFFYDLGSPYSYLAATQLAGIEKRTGAKARLLPITLGGLRKATGHQLPA